MKTIEIAVRFTAQVPDSVAEEITKNPDAFWVSLPLEQVNLTNLNVPQEAKFVEFETMNVEQLSD